MAKQIMIPEQLTSKQGCFPELSLHRGPYKQRRKTESSGWKERQEGALRFRFGRWRKRIQAAERYDLKKLEIALH